MFVSFDDFLKRKPLILKSVMKFCSYNKYILSFRLVFDFFFYEKLQISYRKCVSLCVDLGFSAGTFILPGKKFDFHSSFSSPKCGSLKLKSLINSETILPKSYHIILGGRLLKEILPCTDC